MTTISRVDLLWLLKFVVTYQELIDDYPELFSKDEIDDAKVVRQLLEEKLDETT